MLSLWSAFAGLALIAAVGPARAEAVEYDAALGKTIAGNCRMDTCEFFTIQTSLPIATLKDGVLFAVSDLSWENEYKPTKSANEFDLPPIEIGKKAPAAFLVYCSKRRPHIFFRPNGKWEVIAIVSGEPPSGAEIYAYSLYWASCHHYGGSDPSDQLLAKLGYPFRRDTGVPDIDDPISRPDDLFQLDRH